MERLSTWTSYWNLSFLKVMIRMFSWRNIFLRKTYLFSSFFFAVNYFFINTVFYWINLSMLMIFLSWALYYAYKICSNSHLGVIQKVRPNMTNLEHTNDPFQKQLVLFTSIKTLSKWWLFFTSSEKLLSFLKYL